MGEVICQKCGAMNSHLRLHRGDGCKACGTNLGSQCPSCENNYGSREEV